MVERVKELHGYNIKSKEYFLKGSLSKTQTVEAEKKVQSTEQVKNYFICLRCGTSNGKNITSFTHKNISILGEFIIIGNITIPLCQNCRFYVTRFRFFFRLLIISFIIWIFTYIILLYQQDNFSYYVQHTPTNKSLLYYGIIVTGIFLCTIIVSLTSDYRLHNMSKMEIDSGIHIIRPHTSNKWIEYKKWEEVIQNSNFDINIVNKKNKRIHRYSWQLSLIGGIMCVFSTISNWVKIASKSRDFPGIGIWFRRNVAIYLLTELFIILVIYSLSLILLKNINFLKKAKISIKVSEYKILFLSVVLFMISLLIILSSNKYLFNDLSIRRIGPFLLMAGSILPIIAFILNRLENRNLKKST